MKRLDPELWAAFSGQELAAPLDAALPAEIFLGLGQSEESLHETARLEGRARRRVRLPGRNRRRRSDEEAVLPRGAIVDKYCIERVIGRGGFAVVYLANHLLLGLPVALKFIRPRALARQPGLAALLCQEARFAARIDHPNVVRVHDVTHNDQITYVVMEYIDGPSLAEIIRLQGALSPAEVVRVGLGMTAGLRVGLAQGLIHRDIKPGNILLPRAGGVKIVDLGLALGNDPAWEEMTDLPTNRAAVVGTYGYMSPEQTADARKIDFRSDIYSLGATLYEAITGSLPFPARDRSGRWMQRQEPLRPPQSLVPGLPEPLCALVIAMLAERPEDRPGSYDLLEQALQSALK